MSCQYMLWQYNGVARFDDIYAWCRDHLDDQHWAFHGINFSFTPKAYTMFMLRWAAR